MEADESWHPQGELASWRPRIAKQMAYFQSAVWQAWDPEKADVSIWFWRQKKLGSQAEEFLDLLYFAAHWCALSC